MAFPGPSHIGDLDLYKDEAEAWAKSLPLGQWHKQQWSTEQYLL